MKTYKAGIDIGSTTVNRLNRIKRMLSSAQKNLEQEAAVTEPAAERS